MSKERILVVDDEPGVRASLSSILMDEGFKVDVVASGEECLNRCASTLYDLILLDVWLPGMDGLEVLARLAGTVFSGEVVVISGHGSIEMAVRALKAGAFDFIEKPLSLEKTMVTVRNALRRRELEEENRQYRTIHKRDLVGNSIPILALRKQVDIVAPSGGRILIFGEHGSGKELLARLIHEKSPRRNRKFVEINCAAIPDDHIESELFGYRRGAFPQATADKKGKFEEAHEGTLFLDEVGDMSPKVQAKLLRVLEEETIEPLGAVSPILLDVRVIATTNHDLNALIREKAFREDLLYRLNVIPMQMVPLRERAEDIPLLARHFLDEYGLQYGKKNILLQADALEALAAYSWPGNVRELKNCMERLAITHQGAEIVLYDLPSALHAQAIKSRRKEQQTTAFADAVEDFERRTILEALHQSRGDALATADLLGLDLPVLNKYLKKLGILTGKKHAEN